MQLAAKAARRRASLLQAWHRVSERSMLPKFTELLIRNVLPFQRLGRKIYPVLKTDLRPELRLDGPAGGQGLPGGLFEDTKLCAIHAKRVHIVP
ncbi:histone H3.3-like [Coregonus clupeaformis]|uniref:histone H3.3-like n=1 Tax=Coregonus clupeaformis TaxID=59861 RepID=UPI001E1C8908|nr:histone H3.3-like [Coregonus clupeaformis]